MKQLKFKKSKSYAEVDKNGKLRYVFISNEDLRKKSILKIADINIETT